MPDDFFAPPAFKADEALAALKRRLREWRLVEREGRFELQGRAIAELQLEGGAIRARTVRMPAMSPQWDETRLHNSAEVRRFSEALQQRLAHWPDRDE